MNVTFKKQLSCTKLQLLQQFKNAYSEMNKMARELHDFETPKVTQVMQFFCTSLKKWYSLHKAIFTRDIEGEVLYSYHLQNNNFLYNSKLFSQIEGLENCTSLK